MQAAKFDVRGCRIYLRFIHNKEPSWGFLKPKKALNPHAIYCLILCILYLRFWLKRKWVYLFWPLPLKNPVALPDANVTFWAKGCYQPHQIFLSISPEATATDQSINCFSPARQPTRHFSNTSGEFHVHASQTYKIMYRYSNWDCWYKWVVLRCN